MAAPPRFAGFAVSCTPWTAKRPAVFESLQDPSAGRSGHGPRAETLPTGKPVYCAPRSSNGSGNAGRPTERLVSSADESDCVRRGGPPRQVFHGVSSAPGINSGSGWPKVHLFILPILAELSRLLILLGNSSMVNPASLRMRRKKQSLLADLFHDAQGLRGGVSFRMLQDENGSLFVESLHNLAAARNGRKVAGRLAI